MPGRRRQPGEVVWAVRRSTVVRAVRLVTKYGGRGDSEGEPVNQPRGAGAKGAFSTVFSTSSSAAVAEALECLGGNGYDEASGMPRPYREAPLNGIWEGSGNVNALDMLRALTREPDSLDAFRTEVESAAGADRRLDSAWRELRAELVLSEDAPLRARRVIERAALVLQGSLLVRHAPAAVADAFCASRLAHDRGLAFGTLPPGTDFAALLGRLPR